MGHAAKSGNPTLNENVLKTFTSVKSMNFAPLLGGRKGLHSCAVVSSLFIVASDKHVWQNAAVMWLKALTTCIAI